MRFIITVDTEADNQWKSGSSVPTLENISRLGRFQSLCEAYGFLPTYLVSYEVAQDARSLVLKKAQEQGKAEVGAHLHSWTTPPFIPDEKDGSAKLFLSELPEDVLRKKIENLTRVLEEKFGRRPTSFRSGRWGFSQSIAHILKEQGYKVDCSVTPGVDWNETLKLGKHDEALDFRSMSAGPADIGGILEVPVTILYTGTGVREGSWVVRRFARLPASFAKRVLNKIYMKQRWCRIFPETAAGDLKAVYDAAVRNRLPVLEFMIHSSELLPGGSIYSKSEQSVEHIYKTLDEFFSFLRSRRVQGATLTDFAEQYMYERK